METSSHALPSATPVPPNRVDQAPPIENMVRVVLRPLATPLPLGFLGLAVGTVLLSASQLHWVPVAQTSQVAAALLTFAVPTQLIAALVAFLARDVVMATGLGLLSASWATVGVLLLSGEPGATSPVIGVLAACVAVALLVPAATAAPAKPVVTAVMTLAATRFAFTSVYELGAPAAWQTISGIIGLVLAGSSLYGSLALAIEDARHHAVLPTNRHSTSRTAMSGDFGRQLQVLPTEVGVRQEA